MELELISKLGEGEFTNEIKRCNKNYGEILTLDFGNATLRNKEWKLIYRKLHTVLREHENEKIIAYAQQEKGDFFVKSYLVKIKELDSSGW